MRRSVWSRVDAVQGFRCELEPRGGTLVLRPIGELDVFASPSFEASVDDALQAAADGIPRIVLDLRRLEFVDSTGLRAILRLRLGMPDTCDFAVVPGPPAAQRLFELAQTHLVLPFVRAEQAFR
jgi:anti-anti-sigma factor